MWCIEWGPRVFRNTMSGTRFREVMKHIHFDNISTRRQRKQVEKFCLISEIWVFIYTKLPKIINLSYDLVIDQQLFSRKTKCSFTQYVNKKPDKFSIKFWLLAVPNLSIYAMVNYILEETLPAAINMTWPLMCVYVFYNYFAKQGYNVKTDKFFQV